MRILRFYTYLPFVTLSILFSCNRVQNTKSPNDLLQEKWKNKQIIFPDKLKQVILKGQELSILFPNSDVKVITYIDAGCSSCMLELDEWLKFIAGYNGPNKVKFVAIFKAPNYSYLEYYLKDKHAPNALILYDQNDEFYKKNNLPPSNKLKGMLLSKNNKVELIGSPVYLSELKPIYYKKIDSLNTIR